MTIGSVLAQFTITLSQAVSEQVAVEWHTADGTALAGVDYAAAKGAVLFAPGETAKTVDILVYGRAVGSEDRSFFVEMLPPVNAILGASIGECIIHVDTTGSTPVTQIIVPTGPQGPEGDSAYQTWLDLGNAGTEQDFIDSLSPSPEEIAEDVTPLIDVGDTVLTAEGTEGLSKPDATTVKAVARRVAYVGATKIATVVLADGDNLIAQSDLTGDTVDMSSVGIYPRIMRDGVVLSPQWDVDTDGKLRIKGAVAGDVLYVCQYDVISDQAAKNVLAPIGSQTFEALRRSYAEAGYNLVGGSFEAGGTLENANDVLLQESTGKAFSGPAGTVLPDTNPASGGFVDRSNTYGSTYSGIRSYTGQAASIYCLGRSNTFDSANGVFALDASDTTSPDNDATILVDASGRRWKRVISGPLLAQWWGVHPANSQASNGANFVKLCEHLSRWGGWLQLPDGDINTTGGHVIDNTTYGLPVKLEGGPNTRIVTPAGFTGDTITVSGSSRSTFDEIVFAKQTNDHLGRGLVVNNTAYAEFNKISAFGYLYGIYTNAVLTSLFIKPLCRFNDIGMYLDYGTASAPNAITIINPSLSLNQRWGFRATRPASLKIIGGSIEGNGWGQSSFHGGAYISNPGFEGGVGVSFDGVHMEQNSGDADIYIATTESPGTVINITGCLIYPTDNTHYTANRIYIENAVVVNLNVWGNSFRTYVGYTPDALRPHIGIANQSLCTVNTMGDESQFAGSIESPSLNFGRNVTRDMIASAKAEIAINGAVVSSFNVGSVVKTAIGEYYIPFVVPQNDTSYAPVITATSPAKNFSIMTKTNYGFTVQVRDLSGSLVDGGFVIIVV